VARRPLEREQVYLDGGRRTTQLMRDSLDGGGYESMVDRLKAPLWSIEPAAGWLPDQHPDHVVIHAPTTDATLRLTSVAAESEQLDPVRWVELVAHTNRLKKRLVGPVRCGAFSGYRVEFESNGQRFCSWALHAGTVGLDASYSCAVEAAGRDDLDVETMLHSLLCATAAV
jgi:hypothetical protein